MNEITKALKALDRIFNYCEEIDLHIPKEEQIGYDMLVDINIIREALKNKKGYWIRQRGIYGLANTYECSVCGRTIYAEIEDDLEDYPYCHCGAKMEGKIEWK